MQQLSTVNSGDLHVPDPARNQVLFSEARHAPAKASVMEIPALLSRLTGRENSV